MAGFIALTLGSVGVVYGRHIGHKPSCALREAVVAAGARWEQRPPSRAGCPVAHPLGAYYRVTLKYVVILLRADNRGEGGSDADGVGATCGQQTFWRDRAARYHQRRVVLRRRGHHDGTVGASAIEGHQARHCGVRTYMVPSKVAILLLLFAVQSRGTAACRGLLWTSDMYHVRRHCDCGPAAHDA
jgi:KUP system potassium uptake protein